MTTAYDQRLTQALRIMVPSDHLIAPGFRSAGRDSALARAEVAFHRLNKVNDHGR